MCACEKREITFTYQGETHTAPVTVTCAKHVAEARAERRARLTATEHESCSVVKA